MKLNKYSESNSEKHRRKKGKEGETEENLILLKMKISWIYKSRNLLIKYCKILEKLNLFSILITKESVAKFLKANKHFLLMI